MNINSFETLQSKIDVDKEKRIAERNIERQKQIDKDRIINSQFVAMLQREGYRSIDLEHNQSKFITVYYNNKGTSFYVSDGKEINHIWFFEYESENESTYSNKAFQLLVEDNQIDLFFKKNINLFGNVIFLKNLGYRGWDTHSSLTQLMSEIRCGHIGRNGYDIYLFPEYISNPETEEYYNKFIKIYDNFRSLHISRVKDNDFRMIKMAKEFDSSPSTGFFGWLNKLL